MRLVHLTAAFALAGAAGEGRAPYPGSPALALALTRPFDRMLFCELHPQALAGLRATLGRDKRAKVMALDGYTGLNAFVPPVERRGVERLTAVLAAAGLPDVLRVEFAADQPRADGPLVACGLLVVNAPFVLEAEMACLLPELVRQLAPTGRGGSRVLRIGARSQGDRGR